MLGTGGILLSQIPGEKVGKVPLGLERLGVGKKVSFTSMYTNH